MIIDWFMQVLLTVFGGFISLFPSWSLPGSMTGFGSGLGSSVATINGIFPVVTLGIVLAAILATWLFVLAFRAVVFVYRLIPMKFT